MDNEKRKKIKSLLNSVMRAVCKDKDLPMHNKIAVYRIDSIYGFIATDQHRFHFSFSGLEPMDWIDEEPIAILDAKKTKEAIKNKDFDIEKITVDCFHASQEFPPVMNIVKNHLPDDEKTPGFLQVNASYLAQALQSSPKDTTTKVMGFKNTLSPIIVTSKGFYAMIMPRRY